MGERYFAVRKSQLNQHFSKSNGGDGRVDNRNGNFFLKIRDNGGHSCAAEHNSVSPILFNRQISGSYKSIPGFTA